MNIIFSLRNINNTHQKPSDISHSAVVVESVDRLTLLLLMAEKTRKKHWDWINEPSAWDNFTILDKASHRVNFQDFPMYLMFSPITYGRFSKTFLEEPSRDILS